MKKSNKVDAKEVKEIKVVNKRKLKSINILDKLDKELKVFQRSFKKVQALVNKIK